MAFATALPSRDRLAAVPDSTAPSPSGMMNDSPTSASSGFLRRVLNAPRAYRLRRQKLQAQRTYSKRPWWRRVDPTIVALIVAIAAVAAIGLHRKESAPANTAKQEERSRASPERKVEPRNMLGALLPHHQSRKRAHSSKKKSADKAVERPAAQ